jgi:hypothetical protein
MKGNLQTKFNKIIFTKKITSNTNSLKNQQIRIEFSGKLFIIPINDAHPKKCQNYEKFPGKFDSNLAFFNELLLDVINNLL